MATLGDLLPPTEGSAPAESLGLLPEAPAPSGPPLGDMLAGKSRVIVPGETSLEKDPDIAKCETLSDLRAKFPELQSQYTGYSLHVERTAPKGAHAGVLGKFSSEFNGQDLLDVDGFSRTFGPGTYVVWVEGPSKTSVDPITGKPKILRKAEISHRVPEMSQSNPFLYPFGAQPIHVQTHTEGRSSAAEVERARGEQRIQEMLLKNALEHRGGDGAGLAASALSLTEKAHQEAIAALRRDNEALRESLDRALARLNEPSRGDNFAEALLQRGNAELEAVRSSYVAQIEALRASYEDRLDRLNRAKDDEVSRVRQVELGSLRSEMERMRTDYERKEESLRREFEQRLVRQETLADDRFRQEREHLISQINTIKADAARDRTSLEQQHERDRTSLAQQHERNLSMIASERERDLNMIERQGQVVLEAKEREIERLRDELARVREKAERFEKQVNMPFQDRIMELKSYQDLIQAVGGGGGGASSSDDEGDKKEMVAEVAEKAMELASSPVGQMVLLGLAQKAGIAPPGAMPAMPPPNGSPAPRTMGPAPSAQPPRRPRPGPRPQQPQQPQQPQAQNPQPQAQPEQPAMEQRPQHQIVTRGPLPMEEQSLREALPKLEAAVADHAFRNPPTDPKAVANLVRAMVDLSFPGQDMIARFYNWIDAENAAKLLDMIRGGTPSWVDRAAWLSEVWAQFQPPAPAPEEQAQGS